MLVGNKIIKLSLDQLAFVEKRLQFMIEANNTNGKSGFSVYPV